MLIRWTKYESVESVQELVESVYELVESGVVFRASSGFSTISSMWKVDILGFKFINFGEKLPGQQMNIIRFLCNTMD
jgi:hypothetical protein